MQWMVPAERLGEEQVAILDSCLKHTGNNFVTGHAGTGKTVILIHALREYLSRNPSASVCIVLYTHSLIELVKTGIPEYLGNIPVMTYYQFLRKPSHYDLILVDEVQDLKYEALSAIIQYSKKCIIAGDNNQSIYEGCVSPNEITKLVEPAVHRLEILYRMPQRIRDIALTILPDAGLETGRIHRGKNVEVSLAKAGDEATEANWVWKQAKKYAVQGEPSAILFSHHNEVKQFIKSVCAVEGIEIPSFTLDRYRKNPDYNLVNEHLALYDIPLMYLGNQYGSLDTSDNEPMVYILTYYSAKGLDFNTIFLPFLSLHQTFAHGDSAMDRRVFFVGVTRSRSQLFLSYSGSQPHPYVMAMPQNLLHKVECSFKEVRSSQNDFVF